MRSSSIMEPPAGMKLTQSNRSMSKCEKCVNAFHECKLFMPSICGNFVPPLGHFSSVQFDEELSKSSYKKNRIS